MPEARDGYFITYYAFNKIILDVITVKFDIQVDDRTITQLKLLHDDIPGYNLPTLEFVLPPVNDNDDLILKEENPENYVHLENVLVHIVRSNLAIHCSDTPFIIQQPIHRPHLLERIYKPIHTPHWCRDLWSLL